MQDVLHFLKQYIEPLFLIGVIFLLLLALASLVYALLKKEKALQLSKFTIGTTGLKLQYAINRDEKIKLLVEENITLKTELEALKTTHRNLNWFIIGILFALMIGLTLQRIGMKLRLIKDTDTSEDKKDSL